MEVYLNPRTLPCEHTYCQVCLTKYIKTQAEEINTKPIPCPSCRRHISVPHPARPVEEWASQFKTGLVIQGLMDSLVHDNLNIKDTNNCSVCNEDGKSTPGTYWCSECEASLCDGCLRQHNRMPGLRHHGVSDLTGETSREQVRKKKFVCKEHDEKIKLFCKDCKKTLCTVCCSVDHRACKEVVTIQAMLPEVKDDLSNQHNFFMDKINKTTNEVSDANNNLGEIPAKAKALKSEITEVFKDGVELLREREKQLLDKVDVIMEEETAELKAKIKCSEIARQTYQQQSQFIQQALKFEDETQLYDMYLSSGSRGVPYETETDSRDCTNIAETYFDYDMNWLKEDIDMMDVATEVEEVWDDVPITKAPILHEVVRMKKKKDESQIELRDIVVMNINGIETIVVSDYNNNSIKSIYVKTGKTHSSQKKTRNFPWSLEPLGKNRIIASIPFSKEILIIRVKLELEQLSTIETSKMYFGLATLDEDTLVAGSNSPPSVDILDMTGNVIRYFTTLTSIQKSLKGPRYLQVLNNGSILIADCKLKSVICLTPKGDVVFVYSPTDDRVLRASYGITSTPTGDILFADLITVKVFRLDQSGECSEILTAQEGLIDPIGISVLHDKIYVATRYGDVQVF